MDIIETFFLSDGVAFVTAFVFLAAAYIWWFVMAKVPLARLERDLNGLIAKLKSTENESSPQKLYEQVEASFDESAYLKDSWKIYRQQVVLVRDSHYVLLSEPADFFNMSLLKNAGGNARLLSSTPGYLISIGLLLTFIGLLGALYITIGSLKSQTGQQFEAVESQLILMLSATTFKFSASIAGIFSSILFSWGWKKRQQNLVIRFEHLCRQLQVLFPPYSIAHLLLDNFSDAQKQATERNMLLTKKINASLTQQFQPLHERQELLSTLLAQFYQDAQKQATERNVLLTKNIDSSLTQQFQPLLERLELLSTQLTQAYQDTSNVMESNIEKLKIASREIADTLQSQNRQAVSEMVQEFSARLVDSTREVVTALNEATRAAVKNLTQATAESVIQLNGTTTKVIGSLTEVNHGLAAITDKLPDNIENSAKQFSTTVTDTAGSFKNNLQQAATSFSEYIQKSSGTFYNEINQSAGGFSGDVSRSATEFASKTQEAQSRLVEIFNVNLDKLAKAAGGLTDAVDQSSGEWHRAEERWRSGFDKNLQDLTDKASQFSREMEMTTTKMQQVLQKIGGTDVPLEIFLQKLQAMALSVENSASHTQASIEQINQSVHTMGGTFDKYGKAASTLFERYENAAGELFEQYGKAVRELEETMRANTNSAAGLNDALKKQKDELDKVNQQTKGILGEISDTVGQSATRLNSALEDQKDTLDNMDKQMKDVLSEVSDTVGKVRRKLRPPQSNLGNDKDR